MKVPNRLPGTTLTVETTVDKYYCTVNYHPTTGRPCGVYITGRGKVGQEMDDVLRRLGLAISRELQGKNEATKQPEIAEKKHEQN